MIIETIPQLSAFLRNWYQMDSLHNPALKIPENTPQPLQEAWHELGLLFSTSNNSTNIPQDGPLSTQNYLIPPSGKIGKRALFRFEYENQGGWELAFRADDLSENPEVYQIGAMQGIRLTGKKLQETLIEEILDETVFFSLISFDPDENYIRGSWEKCLSPIYLPFRKKPEIPAYRTDADQEYLLFENDLEDYTFIGSAEKGRDKLRALLSKGR